MRGHHFQLVYLTTVAIATFGWVWLLVSVAEWLFAA
jgi:hypothetical protein